MSLLKLTVIGKQQVSQTAAAKVFESEKIKSIYQEVRGATTFNVVVYEENFGLADYYDVQEDISTILAVAVAGLNGQTLARQVTLVLDASAGLIIGEHNLKLATGEDFDLPDNAIITRAWYENLTTFTSSTDAATIALGVKTNAPAGIKAAVAISNGANPYDAGIVAGIPDNVVANFTTKTTAARKIIATVAVEALTAGKLQLVIEYVSLPL